MPEQLTDEQKINNLCQRLNQASFIIAFFRSALPKEQGDDILYNALTAWEKNNPTPTLPDGWVVTPGIKEDK